MPKKAKNPGTFEYLNDCLNKRYPGFLITLERQITRNLRESGIETRPVSSNGLWCSAIIPSVLIVYNLMYKVSPVYSLVTYISIGLLFYCALFILFLSVSCLVLQEPIYGGCLASSIVSALLLYMILGKDLTVSLVYSIPAVFIFSTLLRICLTNFPKTFTIGEAMIVVQSIVLYGMMMVAKMFDDTVNVEMDFISGIVNTVLSTVGIIVTALSVMNDKNRNLQNLEIVVGGAAIFGLIMLHAVLGISCMPKILAYIYVANRIQLISFWLALVLISIFVILFRTKLAVKATTVTRKSFHILASTVFMSGILYDQNLITLAAGVGLGLLILIEALRKSGIEPVSSALQSAFLVYSDEKLNFQMDNDSVRIRTIIWKDISATTTRDVAMSATNVDVPKKLFKDCGTFAMTPFYLYCGLACPLLLVPTHEGSQLELLSGVLAIGVGDTAASWFGSRYGFNKWAGTGKTVEGSTFNILSQISTVYALQLFDLLDTSCALFQASIAATVSAVTEAMTDQVDNLILPLITIMAFQFTTVLVGFFNCN